MTKLKVPFEIIPPSYFGHLKRSILQKRLNLLRKIFFRLERNIHYTIICFIFCVSWSNFEVNHKWDLVLSTCCIPGTFKGQKISKPKYLVFNSSKKRTKYLPNSALVFVLFGRIENKEVCFWNFLTFIQHSTFATACPDSFLHFHYSKLLTAMFNHLGLLCHY